MKNPAVETKNEAVYWIGVDVAKATFDAALVRPGQHYPAMPLREVPAERFERSARGVEALLRWMGNQLKDVPEPQVRVVMEATGKYSMALAQWMRTQCPMLAPAIVNPRQTANFIRSLGLRNATDPLAARALAFYGAERSPEPYTPPPPEYVELQSLNRYRDALVRERVAETNRGEEDCASSLVNKLHLQQLRQLDRAVERVETEMKALVGRHPVLAHDVVLLTSIYGVAFLTAVSVIAELGDLRRFWRARHLTAFAGLSPRVVQSGTSVHERPRLCKQGNARARQALYLAAMVAVRGDNDLRCMYLRLLENGKNPMAALGAIMRKLLTIMRAILISGKSYDPLWKNHRKNYATTTQVA
jgi:transposase